MADKITQADLDRTFTIAEVHRMLNRETHATWFHVAYAEGEGIDALKQCEARAR